jgi:glycosyltransferase involved in cell wall biosynthesis
VGEPPLRIARIIGRLNVGGPAVQALQLARRLEAEGFATSLIRGTEAPDEGTMDDLAERLGVRPIRVAAMRREVGPADLVALARLAAELRRLRPDIVHTEAAKAGTLGRLAALLALRNPRPPILHTFHGHSLEGYFSPRRARAFLAVERFLARRTSVIIAVSEEVKADLVRIGVARAERILVLTLGLDLAPFLADEGRAERRAAKRTEWGVPPGARVVTLVARLVPIKRVDRFLRIAGALAGDDPGLFFVVVGDGELRAELLASPEARRLGARLHWAGFERSMPDVCVASDCVALTSDNEGTPVSLIEAQAARVPTVSTRVGGAASVVRDGETGRLVGAEDEAGFAAAVLDVLARGDELGRAGRAHVRERFSLDRLARELAALYRALAGVAVTADQTACHSVAAAGEMGPARWGRRR